MTTDPLPSPVDEAPARPGLAGLLAALAMLGPFSIDGYLPAFPDIVATLHCSPIEVQQTLTAYLLSFAFMILWHGALSDALGRRVVILASLAVFIVASLGCAFAPSIGILWLFRVLQGLSAGAGVVVGRAMIRDLYSGAQAQRLFTLVTMIFAIGPAIAPIIGGWIVGVSGWRSIFFALTIYSVVLLAYSFWRLPETLPPAARQPLHPLWLWAGYRTVLGRWAFHCYAGVLAFNFAGLFLFVAAGPTFILQHLHLSAQDFIWLFGPLVGGIFLGSLASHRLAGRVRIRMQVRIGFILLIGSAGANLTYHLWHQASVPFSVVPIFFYAFGMALCGPGVSLRVLDLFPENRGVAASCQAFAQTFLSSVIAGIVAPLLAPSVVWLCAGQLVSSLIALFLWYSVARPGQTSVKPAV